MTATVNENIQADDDCLDLQESWEVLEDAVVRIRRKTKTEISCEELYNLVQTICQCDMTQDLFDKLKSLIRSFAVDIYETLVEQTRNLPPAMFLEMMEKLWLDFCNQITMIQSIFIYLDRVNRIGFTSNISIWDYSLEAFRLFVVDTPRLRPHTVKALLGLIEEERNGVTVPRCLIRSVLRMFIDLRIYEALFEPDFLQASQHLYDMEGHTKLLEMQVPEYLEYVARRIEQEEDRVQVYLDASTHKKLMLIINAGLIGNNVDTMLSKGAEILFKEKRYADLSLMYDLLSRTKGGLLSLKTAFSTYIKTAGHVIVSDMSRDKTMVQDLMEFKMDLDAIVKKSFRGNEKFTQAEKDAFDYFIATRPSKPAELIAKFMDSKLKTGNKECSDDELEVVMDKVIVLFRFIPGKDIFEGFYKKDLAKRLLLGRSASVDAERAMLSKLKNECGPAFTQKLEGMFKDMELSHGVCASFKQYIEQHAQSDEGGGSGHPHPEVNFNILTMGNWPSYPTMNVRVPSQLTYYMELCKKFYNEMYNNRKLTWKHSLGSAILKAQFQPGVVKELEVSLFQALVIFMYNTKLKYSYQEIFGETNIEEAELKRTLQSLACGKYRVLHKQPKGKDVNSDDEFLLNEDFNVHLYRIRISQVQMRETEAERKQTEAQIYQDRLYQIDAAVVRIMKMRKNLAHNHLMSELFSQLRFPAKSADLKRRIESLIEREYIVRDKDDAQLYHYMA